jgi:signal transduction histidine kinase
VTVLENRLAIEVTPGPEATLSCDGAQIEQVLINLLKNAVDAALERPGAERQGSGVRLAWKKDANHIELAIEDDGPGLANTGNLFVPFFTTKPEGSGIGLVLCRQIAENHGGTLTLENRMVGPGCIARLKLPLSPAVPV